MSFHFIFGVIFVKNQKKIKVGKIRKYDEETEYFEKTLSSFQKASLKKLNGTKHHGGS